jgi:hypothetical protein
MSSWQRAQFMRFGDVGVFDNTYKTNKFSLPLGYFVGVDHHLKSILLAQCLMVDETKESFEWVFQQLMEANSNRRFKTLFTDQDHAILQVVHVVCEKHRLCDWHLSMNLAKNLGYMLGSSIKSLTDGFWELAKFKQTAQDWEDKWSEFLNHYEGIVGKEIKYLRNLYLIKDKWAYQFQGRNIDLGMQTTGRCESMNSLTKKFLSSQTSMVQLRRLLSSEMEHGRIIR